MFTFLGQLSDKQAERNFQITQLPATRRRMRFLCIISGLAYLGAIYADSMQLFGTDLGMMASARILTVLIGLDSTELQQKNISGTYGTNPAVLYMAAIIFTEMFEIIVKSGQIQLLAPPHCLYYPSVLSVPDTTNLGVIPYRGRRINCLPDVVKHCCRGIIRSYIKYDIDFLSG